MALRWLEPVDGKAKATTKESVDQRAARRKTHRKRFIKNKELTENNNEVDKEIKNTKNICKA